MANKYPLVISPTGEPQQAQSGDEVVLRADPLTAFGAATRQFVLNSIGAGISQRTVTTSTSLASTDGLIWTNSSTPNVVTIPNSSSVQFPVPTIIQVVQIGTGQTTFAVASGVTLVLPVGATGMRTIESGVSLIQKTLNNWYLVGDTDGSASVKGTFTASQALAAGDLVNTYNNAGTFSCRKADGSSANKFEAHGFTLSAVASGGTATILFNSLNTSVTGLVGGTYFLSATTPGGMVTSAVAAAYSGGQLIQQVGFATSATSLAFNPQMIITTA